MLEKIINSYLRLDEENLARLQTLEGKIIQLSVTDWKLNFYFLPHAQGIRVKRHEVALPDATIAGPLFGLFKAGLAKGQSSALFSNSIEISGDTAVAEKIRDILQEMDIDWEEQLSKVVGDIAAHKMANGFKQIVHLGKTTARTLGENVKEFLQSESQQVPSAPEMEQFITQVTELQYAVDRAEARLNQLSSKRNEA